MSPAQKSAERFKYSPQAAWRRVENETIILDLNTSVYYSLNDTAAFVWEKLGPGATVPEIAAAMSAEFAVTTEKAAKDAREIVDDLLEQKLLLPA